VDGKPPKFINRARQIFATPLNTTNFSAARNGTATESILSRAGKSPIHDSGGVVKGPKNPRHENPTPLVEEFG
jgi:hypothetical protein